VGIRQRRHGFDHVGLLEVVRCCSMAGRSRAKPISARRRSELMASDHIGKGSGVERELLSIFPVTASAWGLGLPCVPIPDNAKPPPPGSLGELKWDGARGCYMVIDRKQDMFFVLLEQTPSERQRGPAHPQAGLSMKRWRTDDAAETAALLRQRSRLPWLPDGPNAVRAESRRCLRQLSHARAPRPDWRRHSQRSHDRQDSRRNPADSSSTASRSISNVSAAGSRDRASR